MAQDDVQGTGDDALFRVSVVGRASRLEGNVAVRLSWPTVAAVVALLGGGSIAAGAGILGRALGALSGGSTP